MYKARGILQIIFSYRNEQTEPVVSFQSRKTVVVPYIENEFNFPHFIPKTNAAFIHTVKPATALAVYPLDRRRGGTDISQARNPDARFVGTKFGQGPDGRKSGSTQFFGSSGSYVEIRNTGKLDARLSITVLVWVYHSGRSGIILNYNPYSKQFQLRMISPRVLQVVIVERTRRTTITLRTRRINLHKKAWNYVGFTYDRRSELATIWLDSKAVVRRRVGKLQLDTRKAIRLGAYTGSRQYFRGRLFCLQLYRDPLSQEQIKQAKGTCFVKGEMKYFLPSATKLCNRNPDIHQAI